jgi:hypothetical protein
LTRFSPFCQLKHDHSPPKFLEITHPSSS